MPDLIRKTLSGQRPLQIFGSGEQTRTLTHVDDIAEGIVTAMSHPAAENEDFNISASRELTVTEIARIVWEACGRDPGEFELEHQPSFEVDVQRRWPSVEKARDLLGFEARIEVEEGIRSTVEWLREPKQVKAYGLDPRRIGALGGSAGAHLAGMLATLGKGSLAKGSRIRAAVSWSGPMDFSEFSDAAKAAVPPDERRPSVPGARGAVPEFLACDLFDDPCAAKAVEASPITYVDTSDAPLLLVNSDHELVPLSQAERMNDALAKAGVEHDLIVLPGFRHASAFGDDVWDQTVAFFEQHLGKPKP